MKESSTIAIASIVQEHIEQSEDGQLRTHYCNGRLCPICHGIRTAKAFNRYLPIIESFENPHFLTLTVSTVPDKDLCPTILSMKHVFSKINDSIRKRQSLDCLRKLEVTFNVKNELYHPHFHIILDNEDVGASILEQWLKRHGSLAHISCQKLEQLQSINSKVIRTVFGYMTKLVTYTGNRSIPVPAQNLDVIVSALFGKPIMQGFGRLYSSKRKANHGNDIDKPTYQTPHAETLGQNITWKWIQQLATWINNSTGQLLVDPKLKECV